MIEIIFLLSNLLLGFALVTYWIHLLKGDIKMAEERERDCNNCIYHTSGQCSQWKCNMTTIDDLMEKINGSNEHPDSKD